MPIDVVCAECQQNFSLKDSLAGRKVRCSGCQSVIDVPAETEVCAVPREVFGIDPAFQRDKFLLKQKHLSFSTDTRYSVYDEKEQQILYVVRPSYFLRQLLGLTVTIVAVILMTLTIGMLADLLNKHLGETVSIVVTFLAIVAAIGVTVSLWVWLSPKRHITFYRDETRGDRLLEVLQDQKFTLRMATYTVLDADGEVLGSFRKDYLANLLRKRWDGFDANDKHFCIIREDSLILSLLRRFLGSFYGLLRTNFVLFEVTPERSDGRVLGEFNRKFTLFDSYVLDLTHDRQRTLDRRLAIALGVLLDTAEKR